MEITAENVTDYLLKINAKKSTGPGGSSPMILKLSSPAIASPLANLFNHPFPKKGEATDKNNYQPVSGLSAVYKLSEKVMFDQLYTSFASTFSPNMSGFLNEHTCASYSVDKIIVSRGD